MINDAALLPLSKKMFLPEFYSGRLKPNLLVPLLLVKPVEPDETKFCRNYTLTASVPFNPDANATLRITLFEASISELVQLNYTKGLVDDLINSGW